MRSGVSFFLLTTLMVFAMASLSVAAPTKPQIITKRGLTGQLIFEHTGPTLSATKNQKLTSPILLRLEAIENSKPQKYIARFFGVVAGDYDLTHLMVTRDGSPATGLKPLPVIIISDLPATQGTNLYEIANPEIQLSGGYWMSIYLVSITWLMVPAIVIVRRALQPKISIEEEIIAPKPSLADQLRPLVEAASKRNLTVAEQSHLELLLYYYWRQRLELPQTPIASAIALLRQHPKAGELLLTIEKWLHQPGDTEIETASLIQLLKPYQNAQPISEVELNNDQTISGKGATV